MIKNNEKSNRFNLKEVIIVVVITLSFGLIIGVIIGYNGNLKKEDEKTNEFLVTYNELKNKYYKEVDEDELFSAGIKGLIDYFEEKNTSFIEKQSATSFNNGLRGSYQGYGITFSKKEDGYYIDEVSEENSAYFTNIELPIKFISINEREIKDLTTEELLSFISTTSKADFVLANNQKVSLVKKEISLKTVASSNLNDDISYIKIATFSDNTYEQLLAEIKIINANNLIIDLRNNTGGLLTSVKSVASLFSDEKEIIFKTKRKDEVTDYNTTGEGKEYNIVVLINERTASAAEVLATYLKEMQNAILVGTKSYGKGTVQETKQLKSGATIKFTTKEWLTSKGNSINELGITPDVNESDVNKQLEVAISQIKKDM